MNSLSSTSGVYTITNLLDRKIYVGYASNFRKRWISGHLPSLKRGTHCNAHLQNAWNLYGEDNFRFEVLEEYPQYLLPAMEHYWATILNAHNREFGYNDSPTDPNGEVRYSELAVIKRKETISNKREKGYIVLDRRGKYINRFEKIEEVSWYLRCDIEDIQTHMRKSQKTIKNHTVILERLYDQHKDYSIIGHKSKPITCTSEDGVTIDYPSSKVAAETLGLKPSSVNRCCLSNSSKEYKKKYRLLKYKSFTFKFK